MLNVLGRELPDFIDGYGPVAPFAGVFATPADQRRHAPLIKVSKPDDQKLLASLEEVFRRIPIHDGMTLSFHHHLRKGDGVVNAVLATAAKLGPRWVSFTEPFLRWGRLPQRCSVRLQANTVAGA